MAYMIPQSFYLYLVKFGYTSVMSGQRKQTGYVICRNKLEAVKKYKELKESMIVEKGDYISLFRLTINIIIHDLDDMKCVIDDYDLISDYVKEERE